MPDIFTTEKNTSTASKTQTDTVLKKSAHVHHFASFCDHPREVSFQNQEANEIILLLLRRHFITNVPWITLVFLLFIIPPLLPLLSSELSAFLFFSLPSAFTQIFLIFYYLVVLTFALVEFITWYFNISFVTQKRVVDIDFSDLLYHDVAVTKLSLIEDVNYTQTGFIRSLFNYGDVFVQTAGEKLHFDFLAVPNPTKVVNIIQDLIGKGSHA
ncbi:MAG: hypothetical protein HYV37_00415 [Candidatus Levyibacteriota bacterium]|nr:MAG: hypothetical protein HYV37_00415 [Candidatus Levybacteria bacterium]